MKKKIKYLFIIVALFLTENVYAAQLEYVSCGVGANASTGIPAFIPRLTALFVTLLQILIPIVLIVTGVMEMTKATASGNSELMAKNKTRLIKKFLAALFAFMMITFTTNIVKLVADKAEKNTFVSCMSCYLNNDCQIEGEEEVENNDDKESDKPVQVVEKHYEIKDYCGYSPEVCNGRIDAYGNKCYVGNNGQCTSNTSYKKINESCTYDKQECNGRFDSFGNKCYVGEGGNCTSNTSYTEKGIQQYCSLYSSQNCNGRVDRYGHECYVGDGGKCTCK